MKPALIAPVFIGAAVYMFAQAHSPDAIARRATERRAIEAVNWGIPAVNYDRMYQSMVHAGGGFNQIIVWTKLANHSDASLTPNPDLIYIMPFFNTKDGGPIVLEIPAAGDSAVDGSLTDCWQTPLGDVGLTGEDKGKGARYVILPPDHKGKPPAGYTAFSSSYFQSYGLLRAILKSAGDVDRNNTIAYVKQIRLYPLSQASNPPPTKFIDASIPLFDSPIRYDLRFFESLDRMVQIEPWHARDNAIAGTLRSLGIVKGEPFQPDPKALDVLKRAPQKAQAQFDAVSRRRFLPVLQASKGHW